MLKCPVIIMRSGGLDGVAMQKNEYRYLLNEQDIHVEVITGQSEREYGPVDPIGESQTIIPQINFFHKDSLLLFGNQFISGPEKDGVAAITKQQWQTLFRKHTGIIKKRIDSALRKIGGEMPIFVFNLISLRHAQPAAAVAIRELIEEYPGRSFISHSADPDIERPEKISRIHDYVLDEISAHNRGLPYFGGPYNYKNLYHIVLNPTQKSNFINKYGIPADKIFEIPDFLDFPGKSLKPSRNSSSIFLEYLSSCCLSSTARKYSYRNNPVMEDDIFVLSPVRPVYRKRLKESMLLAKWYAEENKVRINFVVTHPDLDDKAYFLETLKFAESIDLHYYHLGRNFSTEALENVYEYFSALNTIGVVASSAGGWENALNEMARYGIPFYMNRNLNSYIPLVERLGIKTTGFDFSILSREIEKLPAADLVNSELRESTEVKAVFDWVNTMLMPDCRKETVRHNYCQAYKYLSRQATCPKVSKMILEVSRKSSRTR